MGVELMLRYAGAVELRQDYEANLCKGRAFVAGASGLAEREFCSVLIEHPDTGASHAVAAEVVWVNPDPLSGGTGVQFCDFGVAEREALRTFVYAPQEPAPAPSSRRSPARAAQEGDDGEPGSESSPSVRNLHDRVRALNISERDALARSGSLPERVALERRYGSSVWEGLLHNPQLTPREVCRMAKSTSLPATLVNLIVANRAWLADTSIQQALLQNPRVSGAHLDRVLRALPQSELVRIAEQSSQRMQVRIGAKRLIRR